MVRGQPTRFTVFDELDDKDGLDRYRSFAVYEPFPDHEFESRNLIFQQRNVVVTITITSPLGTEAMDDQIKAIAEDQNSKIVEHLE